MSTSIRIGMLTPSSNTVLEPVTFRMLERVPDITPHFSRFRVTEIALSQQALRQFDDSEIVRAAELLAHAKVSVIAWNGTSASWLGFDRDERLCERITAATGVAACTSMLAFRDILRRKSARRIGLVTPYLDDVQAKIVANWASSGFVCSAERHLGLEDNFSFAEIPERTIAELVREVVNEGCDAAVIVCTNMRGAGIVNALEIELEVPVYDSISTTVWQSLLLAGVAPSRVQGWGSLFTDERLAS